MTICNAWMGRSQSFCVWQQERHAFYVLVLLLSYLHVFHPETPPQHECVESGDRFVHCERVARRFVSEVADRSWYYDTSLCRFLCKRAVGITDAILAGHVVNCVTAEDGSASVATSLQWSVTCSAFRTFHITLLSLLSVSTQQRFRLRGLARTNHTRHRHPPSCLLR